MELLRNGPEGKATLDVEAYRTRFQAAMCEDFNTPQVIAILHQVAKAANQSPLTATCRNAVLSLFQEIGAVLQIFQQEPTAFLDELKQKWIADQGIVKTEITSRIEARNQARRDRNWQQADALRAELHNMGIGVQDTPSGTLWTIRMQHGDETV